MLTTKTGKPNPKMGTHLNLWDMHSLRVSSSHSYIQTGLGLHWALDSTQPDAKPFAL